MTGRALASLICWFVITSGALADAPISSPRPPLRPAFVQVLRSPDAVRKPPRQETRSIPIFGNSTIVLSASRPKARPSAAQRPSIIVQAVASTGSISLMATVRPPARPENLRRLSQAIVFRPQPVPDVATGGKGSVCGDDQIRGSKIPVIKAKFKGCGLADGVQISAVSGVTLSAPSSMDCTTAKALKTWVEMGVKPAVRKLGGGVAQLRVAAGYSCRTRNSKKGARISEHGRGRAIDISAIVLANGTAITVLKGWGAAQHGKVLRAAHKAACGPFSTVLGPGSDQHHRDHFHLDTARGRGPYCR